MPYLARLWWALRDELAEPLEAENSSQGRSTATAAASCLRKFVAAGQPDFAATKNPTDAASAGLLLPQVARQPH